MSGPNTIHLVRLGASIGLAQLPNGDVVGIAVGEQWRMVTAIFLHGGILHLLMNAYALWLFGPVVERELGRGRFLLIFLTKGLFASAASYAGSSGLSSRTTTGTASWRWRRRACEGWCRS